MKPKSHHYHEIRLALSQRTERLLVGALHAMRSKYRRGEVVTFGDLFRPLGPRAAAMGSAFVTLPLLLPVTIVPISGPIAALVAVLGMGMCVNAWRQEHRDGHSIIGGTGRLARLRNRLLDAPFPERVHRVMSGLARRTVRFKRRACRERMVGLTDGYPGQMLCGVALILGAALLVVPIPFIPLGNTIPAFTIVLCAIGWTERDGYLVMVGWLMAILAIVYFTAMAFLGVELLQWLKEMAGW